MADFFYTIFKRDEPIELFGACDICNKRVTKQIFQQPKHVECEINGKTERVQIGTQLGHENCLISVREENLPANVKKLIDNGIELKVVNSEGPHILNGKDIGFDECWTRSIHKYSGEDIASCMFANRIDPNEETPSFYTVAWRNLENGESYQVHYLDADEALPSFCRLIKNIYFYEEFKASV